MGDAPRSDLYNDVYFSAEGGPAETAHVFLDGNDLPARWQGVRHHTIAETGFGTGLNFLLAWQLFDKTAPPGAFLDYVSVEKHPLSPAEIAKALSPWTHDLTPYLDKLLHHYPLRIPGYHRIVFDKRVALTLIFDDANDALAQITGAIDTWFLDGFTPSKNPDMWTQGVFDQMARLSHDKTRFATFTAAGFVKRGLQAAGFTVLKQKGFGTKRDMLAGSFSGRLHTPLSTPKKIAIVGAGLAGTTCAYVLKQYGFDPVLYDGAGVASGASGNPLGMAGPRLNALRDSRADFYMTAYALARRAYADLADAEVRALGGLHLITDADAHKRFTQTMQNWSWHADHMQWLDAQQASDCAGVRVDHEALWLPDKLSVCPAKLCATLACDVPLVTRHIDDLTALNADAIILANAAAVRTFAALPMHTMRGQITQIAATQKSEKLKTNLHYGGYLSAAQDGHHYVGATYQRWLEHTDLLDADNADNIAGMIAAVPALTGDYTVRAARAALRCAAKDHFPVIGHLRANIYLSTAHGSYGIVSSLAGAHLLADQLRSGVRSQSLKTQNALSPGRFSHKLS